MLNNRQLSIIKYLADQSEYITVGAIAEEFEVSNRTVRNDLDDIQYFLSGEPVTLERRPRVGIRLLVNQGYDLERILADEMFHDYSPQERAYIILVILVMRGKTTIDELEQDLQVSRNTVVKDIKLAEKLLEEHGILLDKKAYYGMELNASEEHIRNFLFNIYVHASNNYYIDIIKHIEANASVEIEVVREMIRYIEHMDDIIYSDEALRELDGMLLASLQRIQMGQHVTESETMLEMEEDVFFFYLLKYFRRKTEYDLTDGDISYLAMLFRITKSLSNRHKSSTEEEKRIEKLAYQLILELGEKLDVEIDTENEISEKMVMHLKVAIFRLKNHIRISNPLLDEIKYSSAPMYKLTEEILRADQELFGVIFSEEEIAYITMYFEMLYQQYSRKKSALRIIIVCNGGIATSTLLKQRLQIFLKDIPIYKILRYKDVDSQIDLIKPDLVISTVPLELQQYNVIQVNPILNATDLSRISAMISNVSYQKETQFLMQRIGKKITMIENLIPEKYARFGIHETDWRRAIRRAAEPLLNDQKIENEYIDDMIQVVEQMGNYMVFIPEIAFVHSSPKHVLKNSIALMVLDEALSFGSKTKNDVKVIIVVANENENYNLANLIQILLVEDNLTKLKQAKSYEDILLFDEEPMEQL